MPLRDSFGIIAIIALFIFVNTAFLNPYTDAWWDSAVYVGMGKYIWSYGKYGLWEPARPIMLPLIIGFFWKMGLGTFFMQFFLVLTGGLSIYFVYLIMRDFCDLRSSLLFSFLFSINASFFYFSSRVMADVPAMLFLAISFFLAIKAKGNFTSGLFAGIAILTKFTSIVFLPIFLLAIFSQKKSRAKAIIMFSAGIFISVLPFLAFNQLAYGDPLSTFTKGRELITDVVGNLHCPKNSFFYASHTFKTIPLVALLSLVAIITFVFGKKSRKSAALIAALLLPLAYHTFFVNCKDIRYSIIFLPYLYVLAAIGYAKLKNKKSMRMFLIALIIMQALYSAAQVYTSLEKEKSSKEGYSDFYDFLENKKIEGEIWSSTPMIIYNKDAKISELIYYPVFDNKKIRHLEEQISANAGIQYIFLDYCDVPCVAYDTDCAENKERLFSKISSDFRLAFDREANGCKLKIYEWQK